MAHKKPTTKKQEPEAAVAVATVDPLTRDLIVAMFIVSVVINMFVLIGWVTLQVTTVYDSQVAAFLFTR
jgi:hypothetical protein